MARTQIINHPAELHGLAVFPGLRSPGRGRIVIADDKIPEATRRQWERQINRSYFACGCDASALGLIAGVAGYGLWMALRPDGFGAASWRDLGVGFVAVLATAFMGKLVGLARAQMRLSRTIAAIAKEWPAPPRPQGNFPVCG
jgi:hypothetical protein